MAYMNEISLLFFSSAMFLNGTLFFPQIIRILKKKHADDVSLLTFLGFNLIQLSSVIHGYLHNDKALMYGMAYSFLTCAIVTLLIIYYRRSKFIKEE